MLTTEQKIRIIENEMIMVSIINNVVLDAISFAEYSGEADYMILLEMQRKHILNIKKLF